MWVSVLGPLQVRGQDGEVTVAAAKQRAVLTALLVRANRVVSFDEVASDVWDGDPPGAARATLRNYVKSLRRLLGPEIGGRIITRDPGYLIRLAGDEADTLRLRALCARGGAALHAGEWAVALRSLAEALARWRGTPLADIPSRALRGRVLPELDSLRLQALEWRLEADLRLGRASELVLELQALAAGHPLRERFHAQLMLALYRSGRAAEALAAFEAARQALATQLGADPGPELRRLHLRMLRTDPALTPAEEGAARLLAGSGAAADVPVTGARQACPAKPARRVRPTRCPSGLSRT